jgi:hypothetical protein
MLLFIDTEFSTTMPDGTQLVSLGIVGKDDRFVFYTEREPLPTPTDFVFAVVYPLLERGAKALPDAEFGRALRAFIEHVATATGEPPTIAYDFWQDRSLFLDAWAGQDERLPDASAPVGWFDLTSLGPHYEAGRQAFFDRDPATRRRQHHALVDAHAARAGYLHAVRILAGG